MLLERLALENYGVYEARSEFDLSTTPEKPIVLVGGMNGDGKTTIFESLMVGLYGKSYLGRRTTKKEYSEFILSRLHRHGGERADSACVEISFRFYHNGREDGYTLNRSWIRDGASVSESLVVRKNGDIMSDVDESQWQSFIEGLLPLGIARLFFFDGEKIVRMTEWDDPENGEIKTSLDMLLGAELVNRLYSDLDVYMVRKSGSPDRELEKEYEEMRREKDAESSEIELLGVERDKKNAEIQSLMSKVGIMESKIAGMGGGYADIRGSLMAKKDVHTMRARDLSKTILDDLTGDAPFYLVRPMLEGIRDKIEEGAEIRQQRGASAMITDNITRLRTEMSTITFWSEPVALKKFDEAMDRLGEMSALSGKVEFFDISLGDEARMIRRIDRILEGSGRLKSEILEYAKATEKLEGIESDLVKIPRDDELGPRISEINSLHQEIGVLKSEVDHLGQEISSKNAHIKITKSKLKRLIDSIHGDKAVDAGVRLASKMQGAITEYSKSLRERKIKELESNLLDAARALLHKKHIHRIEIDRKTFEIRAYARGDDENPNTLKSMGEKQIVGTALMWAIARTSGRALPFVIDTPLGRLDGKHLSNLTERFYPVASHQMILLSTDREIGPDEYKQLSGHTSRSYRITCDEQESVTTVKDGYFEVES